MSTQERHPPAAARVEAPVRRRARQALENVLAPVVERASRRYVAGPTLADARRVCGDLASQRYGLTICLWPLEGTSPRAVADGYLEALAQPPAEGVDWHLSVKVPDLAFSPDLVGEVAAGARKSGVRLHFDSHGPETADRTFDLADRARAEIPEVGVTLPARWLRSKDDVARIVERGFGVRVVKGQWKDPDHPVPDERRAYLDLIERLAGSARHVAVASHDPVVVLRALELLRDVQTPCELQLLYGLPARPALKAARQFGVPVRWYVGYGQGWLPYCAVQLVKNPRIGFRLLRDAVARGPRRQGRTGKE